MPRRNHMKHNRRSDIRERYDTDSVSMPRHPEILYLVVKPLKTIFRNIDADPAGPQLTRTISRFDDWALRLIQKQL